MLKPLFFIAFIALVTLSCNKKEDCTPGELSSVIVGKWDLTALGTNAGSVEFKSDGTLVDPDDVLIGGESGGVILDQKSYQVLSNTLVSVRAENGGQFVEAEFHVTSYTCDEIKIDVIGIEGIFSRK
jgi:hypothetical protein